MKAVVVRKSGGPEVLEYCDVPVPVVKKGWSLIKVLGFGINHSEIFTREGKSPSVKFPRILGIEAVGEIAESTDERRLPKGQRVMSFMGEMGRSFDGSYAEYALLPNKQLFPIHSDLKVENLAAVPETFYTAYGALAGLQLKSGDSLLIRGGTSGVGVAAMRLVKTMLPKIKVTGTTRHVHKQKLMLKAGFDSVVFENNDELTTLHKYNKILDLIGPKTVRNSLKLLKKFGIVSSTGQLGGIWELNAFDPIFQIPNNRYLTSFYSGDVDATLLDQLLKIVSLNKINTAPEKVFRLNEIRKAHEYLESSQSFGKVVVIP